MSLYKDPVSTLLNVVGSYNDIELAPEDYDFINPQMNDTGTNPNQNSRVILKANNNFAPFQGEIEIFYNRLDFTDLAKLVTMTVRAPSVTTSHDLLPYLNDRFGLNIAESDVVLVDAEDYEDYKIVQLTASKGSVGWFGTTSVSVAQGDIPLEDYLTKTALNGLSYPTPYVALPFAQIYSYWRDFTEHVAYLKGIVKGQVIPQELADILTMVTGDTWIKSGYGKFSLGGSTILYAGKTEGNGLMNTNYTYGIQIRLNLADAFGITGDLIIHFNELVDPFAEPL